MYIYTCDLKSEQIICQYFNIIQLMSLASLTDIWKDQGPVAPAERTPGRKARLDVKSCA